MHGSTAYIETDFERGCTWFAGLGGAVIGRDKYFLSSHLGCAFRKHNVRRKHHLPNKRNKFYYFRGLLNRRLGSSVVSENFENKSSGRSVTSDPSGRGNLYASFGSSNSAQ